MTEGPPKRLYIPLYLHDRTSFDLVISQDCFLTFKNNRQGEILFNYFLSWKRQTNIGWLNSLSIELVECKLTSEMGKIVVFNTSKIEL